MKNDLTGMKFGRLTAISISGKDKWGAIIWRCKCDCGNYKNVRAYKLKNGNTKSCGCYFIESLSERTKKHGLLSGGKPRIFTVWNDMKARCFNKSEKAYKSYGGRGIIVCDEWLVFENFYKWAMSNGYNDELTIDRINNNEGYFPSNCRFVTMHDNAIRQRKSIMIKIGNIEESASGWSRITGLSRTFIVNRYRKYGYEKFKKATISYLQKPIGYKYFDDLLNNMAG